MTGAIRTNGPKFETLLNDRVSRSLSALRTGPGDIAVGILDIACFTVKTVGWIQLDMGLAADRVQFQLVNIAGAETGAWAAKGRIALIAADLGIGNDQMRGLIFAMHGF